MSRNKKDVFVLIVLALPFCVAGLSNYSVIVQALRARVIADYNVMNTIKCFIEGGSVDCAPPWIAAADYSAFGGDIAPRTGSDGWCYEDNVYLTNQYQYSWGWSAQNVSTMLQSVSNKVSGYATHICLYNTKCNATYSGNQQTMFDTYLGYVNQTFIAQLTKRLAATPNQTFCPDFRSYSALNFITDIPGFGTEYFGMHNTILIPGVFNNTNTTFNTQLQYRSEGAAVTSQSSAVLETIMLYMVFGAGVHQSAHPSLLVDALDNDHPIREAPIAETEIYPGCTKRRLAKSGCPGAVPSRAWDLAGKIIPMQQRKFGVTEQQGSNQSRAGALLSATASPGGLEVEGSAQSCSAAQSIGNNIKAIQAARAVAATANSAISAYGLCSAAITAAEWAPVAVATPLGATVFGAAVLAGTAFWVADTVVNYCNILPSCTFIPQSVRDAFDGVENIQQYGDFATALGESNFLGAALDGAELATGINLDKALGAAQAYQQTAKACCASDCNGAACQQAADYCAKDWASPSCSG